MTEHDERQPANPADLADRNIFELGPEAWQELQALLDRPRASKPRIAALLAEPSVLEQARG